MSKVSMTGIIKINTINIDICESKTVENEIAVKENIDILDEGYGRFIVLIGFLINFTVFGISYSYGVLLTYYKHEQFGESTILTFIGTTNVSVLGIGSIITGRIDEYIGHKRCIFNGGLLFSLGILISSWATEVWHLLITQGFMMGFGGSMAFIAVVSAVIEWFEKRRGLACGIAFAGSGIGGLVLASLLQYLILIWGNKFNFTYI